MGGEVIIMQLPMGVLLLFNLKLVLRKFIIATQKREFNYKFISKARVTRNTRFGTIIKAICSSYKYVEVFQCKKVTV